MIEVGTFGGATITAAGSPPTPPAAPANPVEAGAAMRRDAEMAQLQRDDFPAYARELSATLSPEDRANPFAYSLGHDVPIEIKRQVWAEYQAGENAPRTEVGSMAGANASYTEADGPNGTIRVNADLIAGDPARPGQLEAFAVWGHMEEVGHWADARAQALMGRPGGDASGDEGARYALVAMNGVTDRADPRSMIASYDIPVTGGPARTVEVDSTVLQALAASKLANGSFASENRMGGVENFGPEGHYQTTYLTAMGVGSSMGLSNREVDQMANRLALGSQLPDMLGRYDAYTQGMAKKDDVLHDLQRQARHPFTSFEPSWTQAEQQHLESVYEGLHALPRDENATRTWQRGELAETRAFIQERIAQGDYVTAGVAIHRYGDLHAHVRPSNGLPYSGDLGHGLSAREWGNSLDSHAVDYLFTETWSGYAAPWSKAIDYQSALSDVIAAGVADGRRMAGQPVSAQTQRLAAEGGRLEWRNVYNTALAASARQVNVRALDGADAKDATERWFRNEATDAIRRFHQMAGGGFDPLPISQMEVGGGYQASAGDVRSLETVKNRFDAVP